MQAAETTETQSVIPSPTEDGGVSYVSIDINPSIELTVKYGVVLDVTAYNDDGTEILLSTDVSGKTPEAATTALIAEFAAQGYITPDNTDAAIVITVYGDDEDGLLVNIQSAASESLTGLGITCDLVASAVEPDIAQTAKAAGITPGRYLLIKYLADRDGITVEEAWQKYGSMKMKELLNLIPNPGEVYGDDAYVYLASVVAGLTPEQLQILNQAQLAYQTAMKTAVKTYNQAKADARAYFKAARDAAHDAFKETHDKNAWQQAKAAAKQEMQQRYRVAKQAFNTARTQAQEAFMTAIANLGLSEEQIQALLEWDFELEWNFDYNWSESEETVDTEDQNDQEGQEDQEDQDDQDGEDNEENGGQSDGQGNGHGNHGNGNG
jgi:hypothetical protein